MQNDISIENGRNMVVIKSNNEGGKAGTILGYMDKITR